jgi:hypothetical protein
VNRAGRLRRLGEALPGAAATATVDRLKGAWKQVVGAALAEHARPVAIRRRILVLGCTDPAILSSLRLSVSAAWPELQSRIERLTGLKLAAVQVEPCDPEAPAPPRPMAADPFAEILKRYRARAKEPLDSRRR